MDYIWSFVPPKVIQKDLAAGAETCNAFLVYGVNENRYRNALVAIIENPARTN